MEIKKINRESAVVKFVAEENGAVVGRAYLYLIYNDVHRKPYGLLEDVFIKEKYRGKGRGARLVKAVIAEARKRGCYKLIATSRRERSSVHEFYEKLGFKNYGLEFRMDF